MLLNLNAVLLTLVAVIVGHIEPGREENKHVQGSEKYVKKRSSECWVFHFFHPLLNYPISWTLQSQCLHIIGKMAFTVIIMPGYCFLQGL